VTVAKEVETLKLYLDIERMRFEERLRTTFRIDEPVEGGLLPSLLLQPLVENAIKYAVSTQESGAEITIAAQLVGQNLRITVSDTGPGLQNQDGDHRLNAVSFDGGRRFRPESGWQIFAIVWRRPMDLPTVSRLMNLLRAALPSPSKYPLSGATRISPPPPLQPD
jgi:autotransporter translocation and assembly factor TamB